MSDMDNLEALKRMFEAKVEEEKTGAMDREKRFIADATKTILGKDSKISAIQGYAPKEMIDFLEKPISEIKASMGGEWAEMDDDALENLIYLVEKKVKKSTLLLDWEE